MERFSEQEPDKFPETKSLQFLGDFFCSVGLIRIKLHLRNCLDLFFPPCLLKCPFEKTNETLFVTDRGVKTITTETGSFPALICILEVTRAGLGRVQSS